MRHVVLLVGLQDGLMALLQVHVLVVSRFDVGQEAVGAIVVCELHLVLVNVTTEVVVVLGRNLMKFFILVVLHLHLLTLVILALGMRLELLLTLRLANRLLSIGHLTRLVMLDLVSSLHHLLLSEHELLL